MANQILNRKYSHHVTIKKPIQVRPKNCLNIREHKRIHKKTNGKISLYKKRSGQAVIETMVLLPLVTAGFMLCFLFFHVHAQHLWMDHQLYQALICLAKGKTKANCETQMKKKIKSFLWFGKLQNIQFHAREKKWTASLIWKTVFWQIKFKKQINLKGGIAL